MLLSQAYMDLTEAEKISVRLAGYVSDTWAPWTS